MVDINLSILITVWLGVGFGLPVAIIILHYLQKILTGR